MHIKKSKMPKAWPVPRKNKKKRFVAQSSHAGKKSINLLYLLRDVLKIASTRKEIKHIVLNGDVKINTKVRKSENFPVQVFDTITLEKIKKNYRLEIVNRKFKLLEITDKEAESKIVKIIGKIILGKDKTQINLEDGTNYLTKEVFACGDSAIVNSKTNKIEKILPLKEKSNVEVIGGKHAGKKGIVLAIEELKRSKVYKIKLEEDKEVELPLKTLIVIK